MHVIIGEYMNKNKKNKKAKTNAEEKQVVSTSSVISEKLQGDIDELKNSYDSSFTYLSRFPVQISTIYKQRLKCTALTQCR